MSRLVQDFLERGAAVAKLALQRACADVEDLGNLFLRRLAALQALSQYFAYSRHDVGALDPRQVSAGDGIALPREFRVAGVQHPLDAVGVEYQAILLRAESQRRAPYPFVIVNDRRPRPAQLDRQRRVPASDQRAAHAQVAADQGVHCFDGNLHGGLYDEVVLGAAPEELIVHRVADYVTVW